MFEFTLPDVGEGVAEGEVVAWHVEVGDEVEEDEVLLEVETDKAVVDLPAPVTGTVADRHADVGDVVAVGKPLVTIDDGSDGQSPAGTTASTDPAGSETAAGEAADESGDEQAQATSGRSFASPGVRRAAREQGVDISAVRGTGPGGRVTRADVRSAAADADEPEEPGADTARAGGDGESEQTVTRGPDGAAGQAASDGPTAPDESPAAPPGSAAERERTLAAPATRALADEVEVDIDAVPTDRTRDGTAFVTPEEVRRFADSDTAGPSPASDRARSEHETRRDYRGVRRTIGEKMVESAFTAPHVTHHDAVDVASLVDTKARLEEPAAAEDVRLTYMPFVMKAVVAGLREFPIVNSELDETAEEIVLKHEYHLGVATATDAGLMVPVVRNVGEKGLLELASEVTELTQRARDRSITPSELGGGTFTVTNFGAVGGEYATPLINYPETAILGLGAIEDRPWVIAGDVEARPVLPLSLSVDHRVIDGADAARFTNTVKQYLSNPGLLLLE